MALIDVREMELYLIRFLDKPDALGMLAAKTEELLGLPLFYMDTNWNVLAFSPSASKDDLLARMKRRNASDFDTYCAAVTKKIETGGPEPFLIKGPLIGRQQLIVKTYHNGVPIGHLTLIDGKQKLEQANPDKLKAVSRVFALAYRLENSDDEKLRNRPWNRFLYDILTRSFKSRTEFDQHLQNTSTLYPIEATGIIKIESRGGNISPIAYQELSVFIEREVSCVVTCLYNNSMVVLLDLLGGAPDFLQREDFIKLVQKHALFAGYDYPGNDLYLVRDLYENAGRAVQYAKRWNSVYPMRSYDESKLYGLFMDIKPPSGTLTQYVADSVLRIKDYDEEYNTSYYETMRSYIRNRMRNSVTADELFIHKTTLNYRLDKMREQFGIEWEDEEKLLHLLVSVYILENMSV